MLFPAMNLLSAGFLPDLVFARNLPYSLVLFVLSVSSCGRIGISMPLCPQFPKLEYKPEQPCSYPSVFVSHHVLFINEHFGGSSGNREILLTLIYI